MPHYMYLTTGLLGLLGTGLGWIIKTQSRRLTKLEDAIGRSVREDRHEKLADKVDSGLREVWRHQDTESQSLRDELSRMGASLRKEIQNNAQTTNALLIKLIEKLKN